MKSDKKSNTFYCKCGCEYKFEGDAKFPSSIKCFKCKTKFKTKDSDEPEVNSEQE